MLSLENQTLDLSSVRSAMKIVCVVQTVYIVQLKLRQTRLMILCPKPKKIRVSCLKSKNLQVDVVDDEDDDQPGVLSVPVPLVL